jgi:hypothetical protein
VCVLWCGVLLAGHWSWPDSELIRTGQRPNHRMFVVTCDVMRPAARHFDVPRRMGSGGGAAAPHSSRWSSSYAAYGDASAGALVQQAEVTGYCMVSVEPVDAVDGYTDATADSNLLARQRMRAEGSDGSAAPSANAHANANASANAIGPVGTADYAAAIMWFRSENAKANGNALVEAKGTGTGACAGTGAGTGAGAGAGSAAPVPAKRTHTPVRPLRKVHIMSIAVHSDWRGHRLGDRCCPPPSLTRATSSARHTSCCTSESTTPYVCPACRRQGRRRVYA